MKTAQHFPVLAAFCLALLTSGCAVKTTSVFKAENAAGKLEFINPELTTSQLDNGRFCGGGWMLRCFPNGGSGNIFHEKTMIAGQHSYGMPEEFSTVIPANSPRLFIRPGNGLVHQGFNIWKWKNKPHFFDTVYERSPWGASEHIDEKGKTLVFRQYVHGYYFYRKTVRIEKNSNAVRYFNEFENLSGKEIATRLYWHPFFRAEPGETPWCDMQKELSFSNLKPIELNSVWQEKNIKGKGFKYFVFGAGKRTLGAFSVPGASSVVLWRQNSEAGQVFAVEPTVDMVFPPHKTTAWEWEFIMYKAEK